MTEMPAFFRFLTLLGFSVFAAENCDVVVLEVGLGGRLDATNVVHPPGCVVTGIATLDFDHIGVLGDTLEKIAAEKAGIMKPGVPCVSVPQPDGPMAVLQEVAKSVGVAGGGHEGSEQGLGREMTE